MYSNTKARDTIDAFSFHTTVERAAKKIQDRYRHNKSYVKEETSVTSTSDFSSELEEENNEEEEEEEKERDFSGLYASIFIAIFGK